MSTQSTPDSTTQADQSDLPDVSDYTIEQSLEYQKVKNLSLEVFITGFANKIKFQVSSFTLLC